ncbi:hypothetical protein PS910_02178 [Pseudomonas fluorescens]|nr:hypothetical protein PS910_02178 [Pseudomonas fluorescens]
MMRIFTLGYLFNGVPRSHKLELKEDKLAVHQAALHLIMLHYGDSENSLVMPAADATSTEILEQAERLGLTQVRVAESFG